MFNLKSLIVSATFLSVALADLSASSLTTFKDSLKLSTTFDPIQAAYWTGYPHHRRTPFAISEDGKKAFLAYLDASGSKVIVQEVDPTTFTAVGNAIEVDGKEAGGLVAHNDGFALLTKKTATGTANVPADNVPIAVLVRYTGSALTWTTELNGPTSAGASGFPGRTATPDINGDAVFSAKSGLYGIYYVVTAYDGSAKGHFGDAISYVDTQGKRQDGTKGTSNWGCSHNTGIAIEAADAAPFATICAEDQGAIWLNTDTGGMSNNGVKISNENTTNGSGGEAMYGMSGSYSQLARFGSSEGYMFAWQSRGSLNLKINDWMGNGYTTTDPRWLNHEVALAPMASKNKLVGKQAISTVGAPVGDEQIIWVTKDTGKEHQNVHVAAFDENSAVVTFETIDNPKCEPLPMGCLGTYAGTSFQQVSPTGQLMGSAFTSTEVTVSGDIARTSDGRLCWPFVSGQWDTSRPRSTGTKVSSMSFACISASGSGSTPQQPVETAPTSAAALPTVTPSSTPSAPAEDPVATLSATVVPSASESSTPSVPAEDPVATTTDSVVPSATESLTPSESVPAEDPAVTPPVTIAPPTNQPSASIPATRTRTRTRTRSFAPRPTAGSGQCRASRRRYNKRI